MPAVARDAHAGYVLGFVEEVAARVWRNHQDRALAELDNVRAALSWVLDKDDMDAAGRLVWWLGLLWWTRGLLSEASAWGERVGSRAGERFPLARARAAITACIGYFLRGDFSRAHSLLNGAETTFRAQGDLVGLGLALLWRSFFAPRFESLPDSIACLGEAEVVLRQAGDLWGVALVLSTMGEGLASIGDYVNAENQAQRALTIAREIEDPRSIGHYLQGLGYIALLRGDLADATRYFDEALPPLLQMRHDELLAFSLSAVAVLALRQRKILRAARLHAFAVALREAQGMVNWPSRAALYAQTVEVLRDHLDNPEVVRACEEGRRMTREEAVAYALADHDGAHTVSGPTPRDGLSARELEVAALIANGQTSRQIAEALVISEKTADSHADHIRTKLGLRSRAEIAAWAVTHDVHPLSHS